MNQPDTELIIKNLKEIIATVKKIKDHKLIDENSSLKEKLLLDSFNIIEIVHAVEEKFKIDINEREFDEKMTLKDLALYIESKTFSLQPVDKSEPQPLDKESFTKTLITDKSIAERLNFNPYYMHPDQGLSSKITLNSKELILLATNDYLGLANSNQLKKEAIKAIEKYGLSMCATPIVVGTTSVNRGLELKIAEFLKQGDCLVYPSCYQANAGLLSSLAKENDLIVADKNIHSSLINGCALSGAVTKFFLHNDIDSLKSILNDSKKYRMRFIVIEGVYSTDGDIAPLDKIVALSKEYNALIIVDDAHGIGVLGKEGRGILEEYTSFGDIGLVTGSLGKALGLFGGFIAANKEIIDYLRYNSSGYFYSTALPPHIAAAAVIAIDLIKKGSSLRQRIFGYKETLYGELSKIGYHLSASTTPIFSILFDDEFATIKFSKALFEKGIYAVPFIYPSVPKKSPRIRLLASAYLSGSDIEKIICVFKDLKNAYDET